MNIMSGHYFAVFRIWWEDKQFIYLLLNCHFMLLTDSWLFDKCVLKVSISKFQFQHASHNNGFHRNSLSKLELFSKLEL